MPDLETVDVPGVEILSAGGPVHGVGSPPEGDFWSAADLEEIAAANRELAGELQPPSKIGHSAAQLLLNNSGMAVPTPGEMPAVGWLDGASFRVEERDGVAKLFADVKDVPAKFADLLTAKAYSSRSVELSRVESQEIKVDGKPKVFEWVVSGLAWLGAKLPAVRTLDEITALYEAEELDAPHAKVFVVYAAGDALPDGVKTCSMKGVSGYSGGLACHMHDGTDAGKATAMKKATADAAAKRKNATGDVVWDPEAGFQDLRDDVAEALNGPYTGGMNEPRFWVADIATTGDKALVQDYYDDGTDGWVVPFTRNADDSITVAPSSDWTQVEQGWVEAARDLNERAFNFSNSRRHSPRMADTSKYTDEQRRKFADAVPGDALKVEDVTDEMLADAGVPVVEEPKVDPTKNLEADERLRKFEARADEADERAKKFERRLFEQDRDSFVEHDVLRAGKDTPGRKADIEKMYEANPEATRAFYAAAPVNEMWSREYGVDSDEILDEDELAAANKSYEEDAAVRLGVPAGQVL